MSREEANELNEDELNETSSLLRSSNSTNEATDGRTDHYASINVDDKYNRQEQQGISWYFAVFLIVNAALGAGLLNFAKAFDNAGGIFISSIVHIVSCCHVNKVNKNVFLNDTLPNRFWWCSSSEL